MGVMTGRAPSRRVAVVPPRYGPEVIGGAEAVLREMAEGLAERGWEMEALTTCARDHYTWANELPEGPSREGGVLVRRFPTVTSIYLPRKHELEAALLAGTRLDIIQQQMWANAGMRVPGLFHHLLDHGEEYAALVFSPYMFWTTYACAPLVAERTVLVPALHDEPFARLDIYAPLFRGAADIWFYSEPERELAVRLFGPLGRHAVVGAGLHLPAKPDPSAFRARHGIPGRFLFYAGRREGGKGWEGMLEQLGRIHARARLPFSLVTCGVGAVNPPASMAERVVDLGFIQAEEMPSAFAASAAYLQPSLLESFSRTIMESWLAGTPVIANACSPVLRWHAERSGAALLYRDEAELQACLELVAEAPEAVGAMAAAGRDYVLRNYSWPAVLDTMEMRLQELAG
jgi:glycosyltransferase involved in cell wall biosynthesis